MQYFFYVALVLLFLLLSSLAYPEQVKQIKGPFEVIMTYHTDLTPWDKNPETYFQSKGNEKRTYDIAQWPAHLIETHRVLISQIVNSLNEAKINDAHIKQLIKYNCLEKYRRYFPVLEGPMKINFPAAICADPAIALNERRLNLIEDYQSGELRTYERMANLLNLLSVTLAHHLGELKTWDLDFKTVEGCSNSPRNMILCLDMRRKFFSFLGYIESESEIFLSGFEVDDRIQSMDQGKFIIGLIKDYLKGVREARDSIRGLVKRGELLPWH
jgi:hypothetical protein